MKVGNAVQVEMGMDEGMWLHLVLDQYVLGIIKVYCKSQLLSGIRLT